MSKSKKKVASSQKPVAGARPGRPVGSITDHCPPVMAVRPLCIKCHSADLLRKSVVRDVKHVGKVDGVNITRRRWTRAMCRACGQWQIVIEDYNP